MQILFENDYYRVSRVNASSPSKVTVICYDYYVEGNHDLLPGPFGRPVAKDAVAEIEFNYITIQTRANNFYQADGILESLEEIAKIKQVGEIYISYGASMGGFAAINFSNKVKSDLFLAVAPLASLNNQLVEKISEDRSLSVSKIFKYDYIINNECANNLGLVIFDPDFGIDAMHVEIIKERTLSELIFGTGGKHSSGSVVNEDYPLKDILAKMPNCVGSRECLAKLADEVNRVISKKVKG